MEIVLAIICGVAIGSILGFVGAGGSMVAVPMLIYVFGMTPVQATTASLIIVFSGALSGVLSKFKSKDVLVGTPYALHIKKFRENRTRPYWEVISTVAKSNFVYVTDIYKTFFYTDSTKQIRSYDYWNMTGNEMFNENHRKLLINEINLIEPDIIVTFGALAYKVLTNQKYCPKLSQSLSRLKDQIEPFTNQGIFQGKSINILPLMHLSGSTRGNHLEDFFRNNGIKYSDKNDKRDRAGHLYGQIINGIIEKTN